MTISEELRIGCYLLQWHYNDLEALSGSDTIVIDAFEVWLFRILRSEERLGRLIPSERFVDLVDGVGHVFEALHEEVVSEMRIKTITITVG